MELLNLCVSTYSWKMIQREAERRLLLKVKKINIF